MVDRLYCKKAVKNFIEDKLTILNKAFEERQDNDIVIISNKLKETHLRKEK